MGIMYESLILHYGEIPNYLPTLFSRFVLHSLVSPYSFIWRIRTLTDNNKIPAVILLFSFVSFGTPPGHENIQPLTVQLARGWWYLDNGPGSYRRQVQPDLASPASSVRSVARSVSSDRSVYRGHDGSLLRKKTGFEGTDTVVDRLIRLTVQTGIALFSILDIVCFLTLPAATVNFIWNIPLSKLYSNCLMSSLNARRYLKRMFAGPTYGVEGKRLPHDTTICEHSPH
ncbi:hypothetical protein C8R44DRAFT_886080 [Mycena epipterygia]|nr:hypothetical protein C8R44DRAFT_886080 [Mycena epipterygia]